MKKLLLFIILFTSTLVNSQTTVNFGCTGAAVNWTVPPCVTSITVTVAGAQGGGATGGLGATVTSTLTVTPGQILQINVGCTGACPGIGYNGGGTGAAASGAASNASCGGGGASDIRFTPYALGDRVIVAGGGGGMGGGDANGIGGGGGCASGIIGGSSFGSGAGGGTSVSGGAGGAAWIGGSGNNGGPGSIGAGGFGATDPCYNLGPGGGGGGGYYGGGGGGSDCWPTVPLGGGGGGGGSSLTPAGGGCTDANNAGAGLVSITYTSGALSPTVNSPTICDGQSAILTAVGGTTYSWNTGSTANPYTVTPTTTTSYTVTATTGACTGTVVATVTVNPLPVVTAETNLTYCSGESVPANIFASTPGGATFTWTNSDPSIGLAASGAGNVPAFTATNATASPISATITITPTLAGCPGPSITYTITVNPSPVVTVNSPTICISATANLTAGGATTYTWSAGATSTGVTTADATPITTTTYTVTGTLGTCTGTAIATVTVASAIPVTVNSPSICAGQTASLIAGGGSTYSWTAGATSTGITTADATPATTTSYTVTGTSAGCTGTAVSTVTVNALPITTVNSPTICSGATAALIAGGAATYTWTAGATSTGVTTANASPTTTTTYTVTGTSLGCTSTAITTVTVTPLPIASAGSTVSICNGNSTTLTATGGGTYSWLPTTGLSNPLISNPVASPTTTTTYTVTVTNSSLCTATATVLITVNSIPTVTMSADVSICNGASTTLTAGGGGTYSWSPATGLSSTTSATPTATPGATTYYLVTVSNGSCSDTAGVLVTVNSVLSMATATTTDATCGNSDGTITAGTVSGGSSPFTYTLDGGTAQSSSTFTGVTSGSHTIIVTDALGCTSTQTVTVNGVLAVTASFSASPLSGTSPLTVFLTNTSNGASNYIWDFDDGSTSTLTNPSIIYNANGTYTITLIAYNGSFACSDTASVVITVYDQAALILPNIFTPNGDGQNDLFFAKTLGIKELSGTIYNRWGKKIATWSGSPTLGWDGKINGKEAEDGTYYYTITATGYDNKEYSANGFVQLLKN